MPLTHDKKHFIVNSISEVDACCFWIRDAYAEYPYQVVSKKAGKDRTIDQNNKLWPMLTDIARQVVWFGKKHDPEAWKEIITGSYRKAELVPNIEGSGFVVLGLRTSKMNRQDFAQLIEYIYAFGADKNVAWSEKSKQNFSELREAA